MEQIKYIHCEIKAIVISNCCADFFVSEVYRILRAGPSFVGKRLLQNTKRDRCEIKYDKQERRREDTNIVSHRVVRPLDVTKSHCVADVLLKAWDSRSRLERRGRLYIYCGEVAARRLHLLNYHVCNLRPSDH